MTRTVGAAIGAVIIMLFLASVATKFSHVSAQSESQSTVSRR